MTVYRQQPNNQRVKLRLQEAVGKHILVAAALSLTFLCLILFTFFSSYTVSENDYVWWHCYVKRFLFTVFACSMSRFSALHDSSSIFQ